MVFDPPAVFSQTAAQLFGGGLLLCCLGCCLVPFPHLGEQRTVLLSCPLARHRQLTLVPLKLLTGREHISGLILNIADRLWVNHLADSHTAAYTHAHAITSLELVSNMLTRTGY